MVDGSPEYELDSILDSWPKKGKPQEIEYFVRWKGWNETFDLWVDWKSMEGAYDAVKQWHGNHPRKRAPLSKHLKQLEKEYKRIEELEKLEERKNELMEGRDKDESDEE